MPRKPTTRCSIKSAAVATVAYALLYFAGAGVIVYADPPQIICCRYYGCVDCSDGAYASPDPLPLEARLPTFDSYDAWVNSLFPSHPPYTIPDPSDPDL